MELTRADTGPALEYSPFDSERFGIRVERMTVPAGGAAVGIATLIHASSADLIILRVASGETALPTELQMLGEVVIHADTLVYHGASLLDAPGKLAANVRPAELQDLSCIRDIAAQGFREYRAHYAANPLLPKDDVLAGYVEWAQSRVSTDSTGSCTWLVSEQGRPVGFATCDISNDTVEVVLNAVHPDFERRGHYSTLLGHLMGYYAGNGLQRLIISTQVWNYAVQRQWGRAGLRLMSAQDTFHIDRRLASSRSAR